MFVSYIYFDVKYFETDALIVYITCFLSVYSRTDRTEQCLV